MVVIGIKVDMITAKNNLKIRTRNYGDWKLLKNGCRESAPCDDSDNEDRFDPDAVPANNSGPEQSRADGDTGEEQSRADEDTGEDECRQRAEHPRSDRDTKQGPASCDRLRRKITSTKNTRYIDFICE